MATQSQPVKTIDAGSDEDVHRLAQRLRIDSVRSSAAAGSGHPTSSMSAADIIAVLLARHLRYDFDAPENPNNDHLIFSKGHASPLLYSAYKAAGAITDEELLSFRRFGSSIEGHPVPLPAGLPYVDVATGSLGQGLPIGAGVAIAGKYLDRLPYRVWVLCGDSELAEGSIWEAFEQAAFRNLDNFVAIFDLNRLGQRGPTMHEWDLDYFRRRTEAYGWHAIEVDGHDIVAVDAALEEAAETVDRPAVVLARTLKGKGVAAVENKNGFHGKPLDDPEGAIRELGAVEDLRVDVQPPETAGEPHVFEVPGGELPRYGTEDQVATRRAYGDALVALGAMRGDVVALDGEVGNSTYAELFDAAYPERYFEAYIAEQELVATAVGLQVRNWVPFAATFAAFFSRAYDFVRMAAISRADIRLSGSHAGVSIGEDGPSQMALEDLASLRAVHGSTVLYPSDPNQTAQLVASMADTEGISYIRTTRGAFATIYTPDDRFEIGGSRVVRSSEDDHVTLIGAGVTLHEALAAGDTLAAEDIRARVIDLYSVKPIDADGLRAAAAATGGRIVTVEDHWPEGGIGEAVLSVLAEDGQPLRLVKLAVNGMPGSGKPAELVHAAGIDREAIAAAARRLVAES